MLSPPCRVKPAPADLVNDPRHSFSLARARWLRAPESGGKYEAGKREGAAVNARPYTEEHERLRRPGRPPLSRVGDERVRARQALRQARASARRSIGSPQSLTATGEKERCSAVRTARCGAAAATMCFCALVVVVVGGGSGQPEEGAQVAKAPAADAVTLPPPLPPRRTRTRPARVPPPNAHDRRGCAHAPVKPIGRRGQPPGGAGAARARDGGGRRRRRRPPLRAPPPPPRGRRGGGGGHRGGRCAAPPPGRLGGGGGGGDGGGRCAAPRV